MNDHRIIIREVTNDVGILIHSCHEIFLSVLNTKSVAENFFPKLSNFKQKQ